MILPAVLLCLISISLASDEGACYVTSEMEDECGSVFYPIVKPLLRYFEVCQTKDRKNAELQDSLDELNLKYSKLVEKHSAAQDKCTSKTEHLQNNLSESQNKDEELRSLRAQISQQDAQITQLEEQTSDLKQTCELGKLKNLFSEEIAKLREVVKSGSGTEPNKTEKNATIVESEELAENEATNTTQSNSTQLELLDRCPSIEHVFPFLLEILFPGLEPFIVRCFTFDTIGSGWMNVIHPFYFSTELNQTYDQYINGFKGRWEHFLGLEKLHILTSQKPHEVCIKYSTYPADVHRRKFYEVICENIVVGDRSEDYSLKQIDGCRGDTSHLNLIQGTKFSTFDRDLDGNPDHNWAQELGHGFWFSSEKPIFEKWANIQILIRRKD